MNNVSVSYLLPESWCKKIHSKNLSVTYTMSNVFTIVSKDYEGVDPEVASGGQPLPRNHVFSLAVTF
jgi:hypothetical protein